MQINGVSLEHFRNYTTQTVSFDPKCNVIFGENAQGKTNLLEAIVYLSRGKSPRARNDREMIAFDQPAARMAVQAHARDRDFKVQVDLFRGKRRKMTVNGVPARNSAELSQVYQTVFFCPEDLDLIRAGASERRKFMDVALCQLRPRYAAALNAYHRAQEQKTRILRDSENFPALLDTLPEFNEQMIRFGAVLIHYRHQFCARLEEYAAANHLECSGGKEQLSLTYQTVSNVDPGKNLAEIAENLRIHMENHQIAERASRLCLSGPHKDDILVNINGREAKLYSSQGQTRTAALSMKLAEREIYRNVTGEYPILLLDDVLSELDPRRQEFVLNRIAGGQVFITCCEDDRLPELLGGKVLHVSGGQLI